MLYNDFCGHKISRLGFGCMRFPKTFEETNECIHKAFEMGVNYFDTAYVYNNSEVTLGKCLKDLDRSKYYVTSKLPVHMVQEPSDVRKLVEESIERLGTGYIDYYLLHAMNSDRLQMVKDHNVINELLKLKEEGLIRHIGFSIHASLDVLKDILSIYDFEFAQIQLNYYDMIHQPGYDGYVELTSRNIPVVIMEPVKGGMLANLTDELNYPFKNYNKNYSDASYCFRFLLRYPNIKVILSGMSSLPQVEDNLNTFNGDTSCPEEMLKAIEEVKENIKKINVVGCTGCKYCMPCPRGVDIPKNFWFLNNRYQGRYFKDNWRSNYKYPEEGKYNLCVGCNACVAKCPQHINIPVMLKQCKLDEETNKIEGEK